jgi:ABC-type uncharacterized transport system substrate-binding protein
MSYGPDTVDTVRRAASYVDRILRGEKPAELPVQAPTKFEFVINAKTGSSSTPRLRKRSASRCHRHCSSAPTR